MSIRWRLPLIFAIASLVFAGIVALVSALSLHGEFVDRLEDEMIRQASQYRATLIVIDESSDESTSANDLQTLTQDIGDATSTRFTLIDETGLVLADSEADPALMENHASRPEVRIALAGNEGREHRYSDTLQKELVYVAIPLPESDALWSQGVVRIAQPISRVDAILAATWRVPLIVWAVVLVPIVGLTLWYTRSMTRPVERLRNMTARVASGDFTARNSVHRRDEMGELGESLNTMAAQLETRDEQLRAETEQSEQMLTAMNEGVLLTDELGLLLRSNPAAETILGLELSRSVGEPLVIAARSLPSQALAVKARDAGNPINEVIDFPDGRVIAVDVVPLPIPGGQASASATPPAGPTLFVIRDETARCITDRIRRDFATNVSHELKTPLAGLSLLAQTLGGVLKEDPAKAAEFVDRISIEIQRLVDLANDLLTLSRLEDEAIATQQAVSRIDLSQLAREAIKEVSPLTVTKKHDMDLEAPSPAFVEGDETSLRTLVRNLLENAIRYTEEGGRVACQVAIEEDDEGVAWVTLRVADNGIGVPIADQSRIFERFYRVDKARSRETGGTGLGLSIVRHVAESHGGKVQVQSTVGVGSTFTVRLPVA